MVNLLSRRLVALALVLGSTLLSSEAKWSEPRKKEKGLKAKTIVEVTVPLHHVEFLLLYDENGYPMILVKGEHGLLVDFDDRRELQKNGGGSKSASEANILREEDEELAMLSPVELYEHLTGKEAPKELVKIQKEIDDRDAEQKKDGIEENSHEQPTGGKKRREPRRKDEHTDQEVEDEAEELDEDNNNDRRRLGWLGCWWWLSNNFEAEQFHTHMFSLVGTHWFWGGHIYNTIDYWSGGWKRLAFQEVKGYGVGWMSVWGGFDWRRAKTWHMWGYYLWCKH